MTTERTGARSVSLDPSGSVNLPTWTPAVLGVQLADGRVRCDLCPHRCELRPGFAGQCAVRRNTGGKLVTSAFAVAVQHIDAIERKPIYHAWPGSRVLTVAAPGCTFRCDYCINSGLSQYGRLPAVGWRGSPADVPALLAKVDAECDGVAFSYTEPALMIELTLALAAQRTTGGVGPRLIWKTNGFLTEPAVALVAPVLDAVNVDIKAADNDSHLRLTGAPLDPVFDALAGLHRSGVWVEVSTPVIPDVSDTVDHWRSIAQRLAAIDPAIPWHLVRFTPDFRMGRHRPTPPETLRAARRVGRECGLLHVYAERALGEDGRNTSCPGCGLLVIRRGIWRTDLNRLRGGACPDCGYRLAGRWE